MKEIRILSRNNFKTIILKRFMMAGRTGRPKQLQLDLPLEYLQRLSSAGEKIDLYETMTQALLGNYASIPERGPFWDELNRCR